MTSEQSSGHYFDSEPAVQSNEHTVTLTLPDLTCDLVTDRGVFSGKEIDDGTRYLLSAGPAPPPTARVCLDLGCGYGPMARTLAHRLPNATVWAIDVNERALALTRRNTEGMRVNATTPDQVPSDVTFDLIWSNPPIRIGKPALHELLKTWLTRLHPDGQAIMVVHKNLGSDSLTRWLNEQGFPTERLSSRMGYRLLQTRARADV